MAVSVLAAWFGVARSRPRLLLLATAVVGPMSMYLALTPRFLVWGLFPVGAYLVASVAIRRHRGELGGALVAANAAFFGWLALTVFS